MHPVSCVQYGILVDEQGFPLCPRFDGSPTAIPVLFQRLCAAALGVDDARKPAMSSEIYATQGDTEVQLLISGLQSKAAWMDDVERA
jgi:hypothetical protein